MSVFYNKIKLCQTENNVEPGESALHILSERGASVPSLKQAGLKSCAPTRGGTEKINLILAEHAVYSGSEQVVLLTNVGQAIFAYDGISTGKGTESLYTLNAADYFTGDGISSITQLVYDQETGTVYVQGVESIPEPTTATLSLLALVALTMRRRRK